MLLAIYGPNLPANLQRVAEFHVHRAGCADCGKLDRIADAWRLDVASRTEAAEAVYGDQLDEGSMTNAEALDDLHFYPCLATLPVSS